MDTATLFSTNFYDYLQKKQTATDVSDHKPQPLQSEIHNVFYKNYYSSFYKTDEKVLQNLIYKNTYCNNENHRLQLFATIQT